MTFNIAAFVLGILAGVLVTLVVIYRRVGRVIARTVGTTATAAGVGLLVWTFTAVGHENKLTGITIGDIRITETRDAIGWGAGLLTGGLIALAFSLLGRSSPEEPFEAIHHRP